MKCSLDERRAVAIWTTRRHVDTPLCAPCLKDWKWRAGLTPQTAAVLGYYKLKRLPREVDQ